MSLKNNPLNWAHPLVRDWFIEKYGIPTEPQAEGWPSILAGKTTLISAPTGSGKTLAAFLACIDHLVRKALSGELRDETEVLYVSPLKALSNDIQKNLLAPLHEIRKLATERNLQLPEINVAVRTGDTLIRERQAMLKKPPHILVTTPESFYILLTAEKSRVMLQKVKTVIVDEIHALANNKRGTHLALSLERLEALTPHPPIRIGLSATQKPLERVAAFLTGMHRTHPNIINIGHIRSLDLAIELPTMALGPIASNELWDEIYARIALLAKDLRSTLVFVNTRRLAERVAHHLAQHLGEDQVLAHHGSLSRKLRLTAENKLKTGELKVLVATASLELGIDIGAIDLVCQIGSPRAISIALQRIGRAGHVYGGVSKGRFFATTRDELLECAALIHAIHSKELDELIIPMEPLDILSQQIVATCATGEWSEDRLFSLVKKAYSYKNLSREKFDALLTMLADGIAGSRGRYGTYLFRDRVNGMVKARRGSRITAITNGGAIPENGLFTVIAEPQEVTVGTLDEDFAVESNRGDIILLGTTSWQIKQVESRTGKVFVEDAHGAPPSVPFWRGEAPARSNELSFSVSHLRQKILDFLDQTSSMYASSVVPTATNWLKENCGLDDSGSKQLLDYIAEGYKILGAIPTQKTIIAERFFDESGGMQLIIHAPFGARINKAWGLALRKCFCRSFNFELQAAATDDGLNIALAEQHSFPLADVFQFLHSNSVEKVLTQAVLQSPLFTTRWRWDATRALALMRFRYGKKVPPNILRMLADDLLAAVFPDAAACQDNLAGRDIELPDHPLIQETMKDALTEALDLHGLIHVLEQIQAGEIKCVAIDTPVPSVFSHEILNANPYAFLDDAPLEERRARAVEMRRILPLEVLQEVGKLDPVAIQAVQQQSWFDLRNSDELHDMLQTLIAFPEETQVNALQKPLSIWKEYLQQLIDNGRAGIAEVERKKIWFAAEKAKTFTALYPVAQFKKLAEIEKVLPPREEALLQFIRGWMLHSGPVTESELAQALLLTKEEVEQTLLRLEAQGSVLRGHFRTMQEREWCERRILARIHRLTLGKLRKEIEPVSPAKFMNWLLRWQHLAPGTQLKGNHGLLAVLKQLQGFEAPANVWERKILAKRVSDYDPGMLDYLCLSGSIGWGRLSPHPATMVENENSSPRKRQILPTSVAPITFFLRDQADWMKGKQPIADEKRFTNLSRVAKHIFDYLKSHGASFFSDIVRGVGHLKAEVETGLWELVASGVITADGFDNLRALIDPRRRSGRKGKRLRPRGSVGRWDLLYKYEPPAQNDYLESCCWMLLERYGVIFRDLLVREKNIPYWRELRLVLHRLEDKGEVRGGRFVSGFLGEQFALPMAVESLRAYREKKLVETTSISISAGDPLNLVGIIVPGERISALAGNDVLFTQEFLKEER